MSSLEHCSQDIHFYGATEEHREEKIAEVKAQMERKRWDYSGASTSDVHGRHLTLFFDRELMLLLDPSSFGCFHIKRGKRPVAEGVVFGSGKAVVHWLTNDSISIFNDQATLEEQYASTDLTVVWFAKV